MDADDVAGHCRREHTRIAGVRTIRRVNTAQGTVELVDCRMCDRAKCPSCAATVVAWNAERCRRCGTKIMGEAPGKPGQAAA